MVGAAQSRPGFLFAMDFRTSRFAIKAYSAVLMHASIYQSLVKRRRFIMLVPVIAVLLGLYLAETSEALAALNGAQACAGSVLGAF